MSGRYCVECAKAFTFTPTGPGRPPSRCPECRPVVAPEPGPNFPSGQAPELPDEGWIEELRAVIA